MKMFRIMYTIGIADTTCIETFKNADDMRDWYEESGLADAVERGEVKHLTFLRAAVNPFGFWVDFRPAWLWD